MGAPPQRVEVTNAPPTTPRPHPEPQPLFFRLSQGGSGPAPQAPPTPRCPRAARSVQHLTALTALTRADAKCSGAPAPGASTESGGVANAGLYPHAVLLLVQFYSQLMPNPESVVENYFLYKVLFSATGDTAQ